jgi:hypothetical protein
LLAGRIEFLNRCILVLVIRSRRECFCRGLILLAGFCFGGILSFCWFINAFSLVGQGLLAGVLCWIKLLEICIYFNWL